MTQDTSIGAQKEQVIKQLAGVQQCLENKGVSAAFQRAAKADPVGDMGFMGSLAFHAILCGPLEELMSALPIGHGELDSVLAIGAMEGISALSETQEEQRHIRRPKSAFYPLGRNKKNAVIADRKKDKTAASRSMFVSPEAKAELAYMFELTDMLNKLDEKEAIEIGNKQAHLVVRKSASPAYQGVERRRRPRPEGLFNA